MSRSTRSAARAPRSSFSVPFFLITGGAIFFFLNRKTASAASLPHPAATPLPAVTPPASSPAASPATPVAPVIALGDPTPGAALLQAGSKGAAVSAWQTRLNKKAAGLAIDGDFGPATTAATKSFQSSQQLTPDGVVGPLTRAAAVRASIW